MLTTQNAQRYISRPRTRRSATYGFSLVELLIVIAIIAIISAIIFAAFFGAKGDAGKVTDMSNMHKIEAGLARYWLDHNRYPDVLFAYVPTDTTGSPLNTPVTPSMNNVKSFFTTNGNPTGLYPAYINDENVFTDPNNNDGVSSNQYVQANVNALATSGNLTVRTPSPYFFKGDAFDISPAIASRDQLVTAGLGGYVYVPRYQRAWTSTPLAVGTANRQLSLPAASDDTYVTCTTWHVKDMSKIIVLFKNGGTKVFDTTQFLAPGPDVADISATSGSSPAQFWKIKPNGTFN